MGGGERLAGVGATHSCRRPHESRTDQGRILPRREAESLGPLLPVLYPISTSSHPVLPADANERAPGTRRTPLSPIRSKRQFERLKEGSLGPG